MRLLHASLLHFDHDRPVLDTLDGLVSDGFHLGRDLGIRTIGDNQTAVLQGG